MKIKGGEETEETDEIDEKIVFMRKYFCVFNFGQMEGVPELKIEDEPFNPVQKCEEVLNNFDLKIEESAISDKAFYLLNDDRIIVPNRGRFKNEMAFYYTAFHEMAHATGAKHRLNRSLTARDKKSYAFEELVSEITSFLVGRALGCCSKRRQKVLAMLAIGLSMPEKIKALFLKHADLLKRLANGF